VIPPLLGWTFECSADFVFLRPVDDPAAGMIRYRERACPSAPLAQLVCRRLASSALRPVKVHAPEELRTDEGEFAAVVSIDCERDGERMQLTYGCVWVDDFYAETASLAVHAEMYPAFRESVRKLVTADTHMMAKRRRRFRYDAPATWQRVSRGSVLDTVRLPPNQEDGLSELVVSAAMPLPAAAAPDASRPAHFLPAIGVEIASVDPIPRPALQPGLDGQLLGLEVTFANRERGKRLVALLRDADFQYRLTLDSVGVDHAKNERVFNGVVESVQPLSPLPLLGEHAKSLFTWIT
jgi:hypothetical protein